MILFLLRHGLAGERETWAQGDSLRPLTSQGKKQMEQEAQTMAELGLDFDLILTSPLVRAYQTAEIVARKLNRMDRLVQDDRLAPGFNVHHLAAILRAQPKAENILLVGHEPDFSETLTAVIGGGSLVFKKGALARVDIGSLAPLYGELVWLIPPKVLART
jgi:phosphohistidine phosphatase